MYLNMYIYVLVSVHVVLYMYECLQSGCIHRLYFTFYEVMVSLFNRCVPFIPHDSLCPGVTTTVTGYYYLFSVENAPREQPEVNFQWCCGQRMLIFNQMVGINYCSIATNTHIYMYLCIVCLRTKAITNDQRYLESIE